jgi:hypothetical protein
MRRLFTYILSLGGLVANFPFLFGRGNMAINEQDFLTLEGVASIADRGEQSLNMFMSLQSLDADNLVQRVIDHLKMQIDLLKKQKSNFLSMFDCSSTEAFKQRVANYYYYSNLKVFTGRELQTIIEDFKSATDDRIRKRAETIELMIYNLIHSDFVSDAGYDVIAAFENKMVTDEVAQYVSNKLINALSGKGLGGGGTLSSTAFGSSKSNSDGKRIFEIAANLTTDAFNQHLQDLEKKVNLKLTGLKKDSDEYNAITTARVLLKPIKTKTKLNDMGMEQTFGVQWADLITSITKGASGKGTDIDPSKIESGELDKINAQIVNLILERLNLESDMQRFVKNRIYSMLDKDRRMFFVGRSYTQLEGILGEINAVIAITALLGEKYRPKTIKWIGSQPGVYSKKQPSIDIVLREIGGV